MAVSLRFQNNSTICVLYGIKPSIEKCHANFLKTMNSILVSLQGYISFQKTDQQYKEKNDN